MERNDRVLALTAIGEAATGLVLLASPHVVVPLLFDADVGGAGTAVSRITGVSLCGLGVSCWPWPHAARGAEAGLRGMLTYSVLATLCLGWIGIAGELVGRLLWPAVVVHAVVTVLLARQWAGREGGI